MVEIKKRYILVTGATGFVGKALCVRALEEGWRIKGVIRNSSIVRGGPDGVEGLYLDSIENCNFRNQDFAGIDTVIHLAARTHLAGETPAALDVYRRINVLGTERLALSAAVNGVKRFVFISSVKVNGEINSRPYSENDYPAPQDAYGISKREAENLLLRISLKTGMQVVILRPPLVYGQGFKANFRSLIRIAGSGLPLPFRNINNRRSFIYLGNLVDAIVTCVGHPLAAGETFMVSDGQDVSTPDLIKMIARAMNKKLFLFSLHPSILKALCKIAGRSEELEKLTGTLLVDSSKIRNLLGWEPPWTLEQGIRETVKGK